MERVYSLDFIKFFAILGVVTIHSVPAETEWGLVLNTLSRFAVPFFFAVSGFLISQKLNGSQQSKVVKKYLSNIAMIYICWTAFYITFDFVKIAYFNPTDFTNYISENLTILKLLYYGGAASGGYQLWFLPALFWSVLVLYIFNKFNKIGLLLILGLGLNIVGLLGQAYGKAMPEFKLPFSTQDSLFFGIFYTTLGFWMGRNEVIKKIKANGFSLVAACSVLLILQVAESLLLNSPSGYFLTTIFLTPCLILLTLKFKDLGKGLRITTIGAKSLGVYVVHVFVISVLQLSMSFVNLVSLNSNPVFHLIYIPLVLVTSYLLYEGLQGLKRSLVFKNQRRMKIVQ